MGKRTDNLEFHGQQWRVVVSVPRKLQGIIGRTRFKHSLGTADVVLADELKHVHIARFKDLIRQARQAGQVSDPIKAEALQRRLTHNRFDHEDVERIHDRGDEIEATHGPMAGLQFIEVARGFGTPLDHHADSFEAHQAYRLKSRGDFRRALGWLTEWQHMGPYVEHIDRKRAGRFISEFLVVGRGGRKASAYLGFLKQYWKWMVEKGHASDNPWAGQSLPSAPRQRRQQQPDAGKRPFTDEEMKTLLSGDAGPLVHDIMRIAALSGMRLEEICQLHVSDCADNNFNVWGGKTSNARRTVPIHSGLKVIVARRSRGKASGDFLIDELPPLTPSRETRSDPAAKRFVRYRRSMGVDERPNEKAKSNVEFHSFRRWFIRKARDAMMGKTPGFDAWTIPAVVGHADTDRPKSLDLSMMGYAGQDPERAKRALVESVKLPQ